MRILRLAIIITAAASFASFNMARAFLKESARAQAVGEPQPIYSRDPKDAWNRIFYHLFTRAVRHRLTDEFPQAAPLFKTEVMGYPGGLPVSKRLFERVEIGDRAIEPFYPSFITSVGLREALGEPRLSQLRQALADALDENVTRPALHRALMQSDVWAAYDALAGIGQRRNELHERASQLLPLLSGFIKKLALSANEIKTLPDNYALAIREHPLPDIFAPGGEWMEVQWGLSRLHDHAADFRRVTRVFVKPNVPVRDKQGFLDRLRDAEGDDIELGAVALAVQNLLIDNQGNVVPTQLTCDIQTRTFKRDGQGKIIRTELSQYELSRKLLLSNPRTGGLISLDESAPAYLPTAGNDYSFATIQSDDRGEANAILSTLRARCAACHGRPNAVTVFTFNAHFPDRVPPVMLLSQPNDMRARYVAGRKVNRDDFETLRGQWVRR